MRIGLAATTLVLTAALAVGAAAPAGAARPDPVRQGLDALVGADGVPGALATVTGRDGRTRVYTAGEDVPRDGRIRIGSVTKSFTAVVVLQLAGEGAIELDKPVEKYLPGLLRGEGVDGNAITVRMLLNHTSGLPDYELDVTDDIIAGRYYEPRDALDVALRHPAEFTPGTSWKYSNTNFLVAGLVVQKITGRPFAEELDRRVLKPAGLAHTYFPAPGETEIRGRHPRGYREQVPGGPRRDVTDIDPSAAWTAGAMVSTNSDLARFYDEVLTGDLVPDSLRDDLLTPAPNGPSGYAYGLGVMNFPLSCGGSYWGHYGGIPGFLTFSGAVGDGRSASIAVNLETAGGSEIPGHAVAVLDAALCR
ncbi:serine hydrolase [Actinorhabdospora filicis]|uniref:Serine hydrolase n=1 Tax=Actinorhabdospora filicis TaxID=1785913 RepID=A0A9W6SDV5_9ACTN|nr:serine hydrolase domain-containing protein [Actinorhabdospora filicis]GLZ75419.1 serine hydrolase [Actinorhabdospora filicis]